MTTLSLRYLTFAIVLAGMLAGCSGWLGAKKPTPATAPSNSPTTSASPSGGASPSTTGEIYVADASGAVYVYAASPSGKLDETPLATISGAATLFGSDSVPGGVAVDANGNIYVADDAATPSINVYAANPSGIVNDAPLAKISGNNTDLSSPNGIALDASGKIYVADGPNMAIFVYAANPSGTLNEAPLAKITGSLTDLNQPQGVAVDASGKIYVTNINASVTVYAANPNGTLNEAPLAEIDGANTQLSAPVGVTVDASGKIYVADESGSVLVYPANPSGTPLNEAPLAKISGENTGLSEPVGIAVDANGNIYVTNIASDTSAVTSINVYAANPSGTALNEAPFATITGSNTDLSVPIGIAIH